MARLDRLFEIIQILRRSKRPVTAESLAQTFEVSARTIYRDISVLQSMQTPIEGEAGVGYILRNSYDLPPLNFDTEEIEALRVALMLLARTGDLEFQKSARSIYSKIDTLHGTANWLQVVPWGVPIDHPEKGCVAITLLRQAIRETRKLNLIYRDENSVESERTIRPIGLVYHLETILLAGWCELRGSFRHFRTDRIYGCEVLEDRFEGEADVLRSLWLEQEKWDEQGLILSDP